MKHYKRVNRNPLVEAYAFVYAIMFTVGGQVFKALDWMGNKMVYLIDHSDFFAGCVATAAVLTVWEMLTK